MHARASVERWSRETRETRAASPVSRLQWRAWSLLRVSGVKKKEGLLVSLPQITRATTFVPSKMIYKNYLNWLCIGRSPHTYLPISVCVLTSLTTPEISATIKWLFFIQNLLLFFFRYTKNSMKKSMKITLYSLLAKKKKQKKKEPGERKKRKK